MLIALDILSLRYGLGSPDEDVNLALHFRAVTYSIWGEVSYFVSIALTKTSIGIAVLRIDHRRPTRWTLITMMVVSNLTYTGALILDLASCSFLWDRIVMSGSGCAHNASMRKQAPGIADV